MRNLITLSGIILATLGLTACDGQNARDILGLGRNSPDEFRVVSRPPLSTPPDFQLRPPLEGEDSIGLPPSDLQAKSLITNGQDISKIDYDIRRKMGEADTAVGVVDSYSLGSKAENALLNRAGVKNSDPQIRQKLYNEQIKRKKDAESNWLVPKKSDEYIVDAEKEKARIKSNMETGKTITDGKTPVVEPKERGVLEGLF